jgi:hypothetical protein
MYIQLGLGSCNKGGRSKVVQPPVAKNKWGGTTEKPVEPSEKTPDPSE